MPHYRIYNRLEFVRKRGIVSDGYGVPHRRVPFAGRHGGNVRGALVWNIRASGAIPHERLQDNMLAQRVATNGAAKVDEFLCEHLHLGVRDAVHAGKGRPVVDAGLFEKHHGRGADFPGFAGTRMCLDPRVLRGRRGELAANATAFRVGICALHRKRREMHDRLVEVAHVGCLVRRQLEIDALVGPRLVLQHATAHSPEVPAGLGEDRVALELRVFDDLDGILHLAEVYVACDKILEDGDVVAFVQLARGGEPGIRRLARGGERRLARLRVSGVQLGVGTDGSRAGMGVDRRGVAVEDGAYLRARKRLDAALGEFLVRAGGSVGGKPEIAPDLGNLVHAYAVLGKRLYEGVLDGQHLKMRKRRLVGSLEVDAVVDLLERGLVGETHFAGIVLAGRNSLKLLDRDVYVC